MMMIGREVAFFLQITIELWEGSGFLGLCLWWCWHDDDDDDDVDDDNDDADDFWVPGIWGLEGVHAPALYKESLTLMMKKNITLDDEEHIISGDDPMTS